jgi:lipase chaperone LimK
MNIEQEKKLIKQSEETHAIVTRIQQDYFGPEEARGGMRQRIVDNDERLDGLEKTRGSDRKIGGVVVAVFAAASGTWTWFMGS